MHVLLIDDEQMVRKIVRKMLDRNGHQVTEAENGRVGLELLRKGGIDLVITDIIMPDMEGVETVLTVREEFPDTKIIVMSGGGRTGNTDFLATAEKLGAAATLHKPFTLAALAKAIERAFPAGTSS